MMKKQEVRKNRPDSLRTLYNIHRSVLKDFNRAKLFQILIVVFSVIFSIFINIYSSNIYQVISGFNKLIIPYYSISIGFTITSTTFLVNSLNKDKHLNQKYDFNNDDSRKAYKNKLIKLKSLYIRAISTIIFYVFYALLILVILYTQILFGRYIIIPEPYSFYINTIGIAFLFFMILYSLLLFILIIQTVYLFCITYIDHTIDLQINELEQINNEETNSY